MQFSIAVIGTKAVVKKLKSYCCKRSDHAVRVTDISSDASEHLSSHHESADCDQDLSYTSPVYNIHIYIYHKKIYKFNTL